ncbi:MAG: hypothetical protein KAR13_04130 [Desulfobulbaceae bacterium]|nr:hypothetical protein [Desulfobulbaceae bacterium]
MIDVKGLAGLCGNSDYDRLRHDHRQWMEKAFDNIGSTRESCWTENITVGSKIFVDETKMKLGHKSQGRDILQAESKYILIESTGPLQYCF